MATAAGAGGGGIFISLVVLFVGRFCIASPSPSPYVALPLSKNVKCAMHNKLDVAVEIKKRSDMGRKHGTAEAKQKQGEGGSRQWDERNVCEKKTEPK